MDLLRAHPGLVGHGEHVVAGHDAGRWQLDIHARVARRVRTRHDRDGSG